MLVLSRKPDQSVTIGDQISLKIIRVRGNTVQLGIVAPQDVKILRSELLDRRPNNDLTTTQSQSGGSSADAGRKAEQVGLLEMVIAS